MRAVLPALLLLACGRSSGPSSETKNAPPASQVAKHEATDPARLADQALKSDWKLDYELPMADKPRDRSAIAKLFVDACEAGDHPSCWKALAVAEPTDRAPIVKLVEANCVAGDTMSCRALPANPLDAFPSAPGALGRSEACDNFESTTCDRKGLRDECAAGFPRSCFALIQLSPPETDLEQLTAMALERSREGCQAWIPADCAKIGSHDGDPRQELALERECELERSCVGYGLFLRPKDPLKARDLIERSCQYGDSDMVCGDLAIAYLDGRLPEPVKGRGQTLLDWTCAQARTKLAAKGMDLLDRRPECKRASK